MRDWLLLTVSLIMALYLQITSIFFILPSSMKPDLVLILVVWVSGQKHFRKGIIFSFCAGIAVDLLSVNPTGLNAFLMCVIFIVVNHLRSIVSIEGPSALAVAALLCSWVVTVLILMFRGAMGPIGLGADSLGTLFIKSFLTGLFSLPILIILDTLESRLEKNMALM